MDTGSMADKLVGIAMRAEGNHDERAFLIDAANRLRGLYYGTTEPDKRIARLQRIAAKAIIYRKQILQMQRTIGALRTSYHDACQRIRFLDDLLRKRA